MLFWALVLSVTTLRSTCSADSVVTSGEKYFTVTPAVKLTTTYIAETVGSGLLKLLVFDLKCSYSFLKVHNCVFKFSDCGNKGIVAGQYRAISLMIKFSFFLIN